MTRKEGESAVLDHAWHPCEDSYPTQDVGSGFLSLKIEPSSHYNKSGNTYNIKWISRLRSEVGCEGDRQDFSRWKYPKDTRLLPQERPGQGRDHK